MEASAVRVVEFRKSAQKKDRYAFSKAITKRVECYIRDRGKLRRLIVTLHANGLLTIRPEKTRSGEEILASDAWSLAVKMRVARERAEKKARKA